MDALYKHYLNITRTKFNYYKSGDDDLKQSVFCKLISRFVNRGKSLIEDVLIIFILLVYHLS